MKKKNRKIGRPKSDIPKKNLTLSVPEEEWAKWKIQATRERTTMSKLAIRLLTDYLSKRKGE